MASDHEETIGGIPLHPYGRGEFAGPAASGVLDLGIVVFCVALSLTRGALWGRRRRHSRADHAPTPRRPRVTLCNQAKKELQVWVACLGGAPKRKQFFQEGSVWHCCVVDADTSASAA